VTDRSNKPSQRRPGGIAGHVRPEWPVTIAGIRTERAGIELPFSCRSGVCSTCRVRVVRGQVRMAQNYALEDWELDQGYVLACQSLCRSAQLELDYDAP
jgi:uncharacterized 2Fe-2S/4Fe-4S cluster protein (DUF4445 family)